MQTNNEMVQFLGSNVIGTLQALGAYLAPDAIQERALHTEIDDALEALCLCDRDAM